jgi:DNA-binding IclR family transcriptional regulator
MGQRGPMPKRSSERRRRNKESKPDKVAPKVAEVKRPRVRAHWHPIAKAWFKSLEDSGQSAFYEPSDWAAAVYVAEVMSKHLKADKLSAGMFSFVWTAMGDLMTTEAARRRVRLEIERGDSEPEKPASVTALDAYRSRLAS